VPALKNLHRHRHRYRHRLLHFADYRTVAAVAGIAVAAVAVIVVVAAAIVHMPSAASCAFPAFAFPPYARNTAASAAAFGRWNFVAGEEVAVAESNPEETVVVVVESHTSVVAAEAPMAAAAVE